MGPRISIRKAPGTWVVRTTDGVLAESKTALELSEGDMPPVIYFPRDDIGMAFLDPSPSSSTCPWKGTASYFSYAGQAGTVLDAGWSYEKPVEAVAQIKDHIAFYTDKVTVEQL